MRVPGTRPRGRPPGRHTRAGFSFWRNDVPLGNVLVVQPGQDWDGDNDTGPLDRATQGRILHHDALEFPDGETVLLTRPCEGQHATVLQLPASLRPVNAAEGQKRDSLVK